MTNALSYRINDKLFLVNTTIAKGTPAQAVSPPINHVFVGDCSGSMYGSIQRVKEQAKKKITTSLKEGDTVTLLWFSGRGECGVIIEGETVDTLKDLQRVHGLIDRWYKTVGLTGFKEPIELAGEVATRLAKKFPNNATSMTFMSDGCDNQWDRGEILKAVEKAAGKLSAATFVEYGYYADRPLLTAMAEKAGGSLIFAQDFDRYEAVIGDIMQRKVTGGKKIDVTLPNADIVGGFVFALNDGDLLTFGVDGNKCQVPEGTTEVYFLSPALVGANDANVVDLSKQASSGGADNGALRAAYAAASLFAVRMQPNVVLPILKATGDVALIEQFANCFGKQAYSAFMDAAREAAFDTKKRFTKGWDPNKVPREDAFTVLELLGLLQEDEGCRLLLNHERFQYNRISRGRVDSNTVLTDEEQAQIDTLQRSMAGIKDVKKRKEIQAQIDAIQDKPEALKFVEDEKLAAEGYEVHDLTWKQDRPNVSTLIRKVGTVDLSSRKDIPAGVPTKFPTNTFRNYSIITDGLVNVEVLPVKISSALESKLKAEMKSGRLDSNAVAFENGVTLFLLNKIPVLNRQQTKDVSAKELFTKEYELCKAEGAQKVYNTLAKEKIPGGVSSKGLQEVYGETAAAWLKEQGFTDNGFAPKMVQAESTDFYVGKALEVSLKGLSNIPSVNDVRKKLAGKQAKLTISQSLVAPTLQAAESHLVSAAITSAKDPTGAAKEYIEKNKKDQTAATRKLRRELAQTKFAIIVGQTWFKEFKSLDENTMDLSFDGFDVACTVTPKPVEIKI
jgi:hypothetical protein